MVSFSRFLIIAAVASAVANAQFVFGTVKGGTKIVVFNDSNVPVQVYLDENPHGMVLANGSWSKDFGGFAYANPQFSFIVSAQACLDAHETKTLLEPPSWAITLGSLSLTREYLSENPSEPILKKRVEDIERFLEKERKLGRKEREKELRSWFKQAKKQSLTPSVFACNANSPRTNSVRVSVYPDYNNSRRIVAFHVRTSLRQGYYLEEVNRTTNPY